MHYIPCVMLGTLFEVSLAVYFKTKRRYLHLAVHDPYTGPAVQNFDHKRDSSRWPSFLQP